MRNAWKGFSSLTITRRTKMKGFVYLKDGAFGLGPALGYCFRVTNETKEKGSSLNMKRLDGCWWE